MLSRNFKLSFLGGDINPWNYGGTWWSRKCNNGDFDFWYVVRVDNVEDCREFDGKYSVIAYAVSPDELEDSGEWTKVARSWGDEFDFSKFTGRQLDAIKVEMAVSYGAAATVERLTGNNRAALWKEIKEEIYKHSLMSGFAMGRPQNAIGASGWDTIRGNPLGGLRS